MVHIARKGEAMNPYIGDRQLDPPEDLDCPYCNTQCQSIPQLMRHVSKCPENPHADAEPEVDLE
jgi:hypothetical protein